MRVLITGASGGIGLSLARLFAKGGHELVLVSRSEERLVAAAKGLAPAKAVVMPEDLSVPGAAGRIVSRLEEAKLPVDILVNNAGFGDRGALASEDPAAVSGMVQVNALGLTELTRALLPGMLARKKGMVLNVASTAAFQPGPYMAVYYATKSYVLSLSLALAKELQGSGVTVTALCPGPTRTRFQERAGMADTKMFRYGTMDPDAVALAAYRGLMEGRRLVIPGVANRITACLVRFAPRGLVLSAVARLQR